MLKTMFSREALAASPAAKVKHGCAAEDQGEAEQFVVGGHAVGSSSGARVMKGRQLVVAVLSLMHACDSGSSCAPLCGDYSCMNGHVLCVEECSSLLRIGQPDSHPGPGGLGDLLP